MLYFAKCFSSTIVKYRHLMHKTQDTQIEHFPDRSLRRLLQDREYVRGLVQIIAPDIEMFLDFSRITYQKRSFISKALQERESDVLLSVPFQEDTDATDTDELLIYILIEHQSTVDKTMGFRLLSYMVQIWESQRREWKRRRFQKMKDVYSRSCQSCFIRATVRGQCRCP